MDPRLQRRVQRYGWDKAAPVYEQHWQAQLLPAQRCLLARANLQPGQRLLILGPLSSARRRNSRQ